MRPVKWSAPLLAGLLMACANSTAAPSQEVAPAAPVATSSPVVQPLPKPTPTPARTLEPIDVRVAGQFTQGGWIRGTVTGDVARLTLGDSAIAVAPDGTFFAGLDRDAAEQYALVAEFSDGRKIARTVPVSARDWNIQHVDIARRPGGATEAFMRIRRPELAQIVAARAETTGADGWRQDFIWPVKARISGMFGRQRIYRGEPGGYHSGIDIAGGAGTTYVAPADGVVVLATREPFSLEGYLLMIDHGNGLNSAFLHNSEILVSEGEKVVQGQPIGRIGATGRATGPHLHWSVKWNDARLDPILLTGPM